MTYNQSTNLSDCEANEYLQELQSQTTKDLIPAMAFLATVAVLGLIGNSLVLFVYTRRFPPTPVRVFLVAVAVFDIIINTIVIPGEIYDLLHSWCFDKPIVCRVRLYFTISTTLASSFLLLALAVTRYRKICQPFSKQVTIAQAKMICFVAVVITHLLPVPYAVIHGRQKKKTENPDIHGYFCAVDDRFVGDIWPKLNSGLFCLMFLVSCTVLVVLYSLIWSKARKHRGCRTTLVLTVKKQCDDMSRPKVCSVISSDEAASSSDTGIKSMQTGDLSFDAQSASSPPLNLSCCHKASVPTPQEVCFHNDASEKVDCRVVTEGLPRQSRCAESCAEKACVKETDPNGSFRHDVKRSRLPRISTDSESMNFRDFNADQQFETLSAKKPRGMGRTSCMLLTISLAFIVGFLPFVALDAYKSANPEVFASVTGVASSLYHLFLRFCLINSCINPIVYNLFDLKFRSEVMSIFGCT